MPQVKSQDSFVHQAKHLMWIENLLEHDVGGNEEYNKDYSAQWLALYYMMGHPLLNLRIWNPDSAAFRFC